MASTLSSRSFIEFLLFIVFVVVSIVIRIIVMSYWLTMHDKYPWTPNKAQLSVFIDFRSKLLNLMAVKNLKKIFREFFLTITDPKLIFVIMSCKSVSVVTGPPSFLLKPKLIWLAVLPSNYWLYDFNATRLQNWIFSYYFFRLKSFDIILILISLICLE